MKGVIILMVLTMTVGCFGQNIHFYRSYGNTGYDFGRDIKQTLDTGYIATGSSSSFSVDNAEAYLLKVDSLGNFKWSYNYGGSGSEWGESVILTKDSAYALAGYSNSFSTNNDFDFFLVKTDSTGVPEWSNNYGGDDWDKCYGLAQLPDSGYVMVGETYSFGQGGLDGYIVRTDKYGDTLWTNSYGGPQDDFFKEVVVDGDSIVVVGGTHSYGVGDADGWIMKFHMDGVLGWEKQIIKTDVNYFTSISHFSNYYVLGGTYTLSYSNYYNDFWVYKIGHYGDTIYADTSWTGDQYGEDIVYDVVVDTFLEDIFYGGSTTSWGSPDVSSGITDAFISKLSPVYGWLPYVQNFGAVGHDAVRGMDFCYDRGLIAIGDVDLYSTGGNNIFITKIDEYNSFPFIDVNSEVVYDSITNNIESQNDKKDLIKIYPNPTSDMIHISNVQSIVKVLIRDSSGKVVFTKRNEFQTIDISTFEKGVYFLEVRSSNSSSTHKIIKT